MNDESLLDLFRRSGALLEGHFRLSSGLHSPGYLQSALVLQHPEHASALGAAIASLASDLHPTAVLSPALGGVIIGHEVARALGGGRLGHLHRLSRRAARRGDVLSHPVQPGAGGV